MFDFTSRYFALETANYISENGAEHAEFMLHHQEIAYKRRRFLPQGEQIPLLLEYKVTEGERLDLITVRTLGEPEQYWRIADANNTMNPIELTAEVGRTIRIPVPQA